jgi:D-glycero-D-manno-heptose 1,7-bisphosphate phosphatase
LRSSGLSGLFDPMALRSVSTSAGRSGRACALIGAVLSERRGAVFLDRDGVLNVRPPPHCYVSSAAAFRWLPHVPESLARLSAAGYPLVVVSNQQGLARGVVSWPALREIERVMSNVLRDAGAPLLATYYCPHHVDQGCACRKPRPGMLLRAARDHRLDLERSTMIGDAESDVEAGLAAGCRTIRIATPGTVSTAHRVAPDLPAAARLILLGSASGRPGD